MSENFEELFRAAKEACGNSETKLAKACGVSQNTIWVAKRAGKVSADLAVRIEQATNGLVPRWKLRPDLWTLSSAKQMVEEAEVAA